MLGITNAPFNVVAFGVFIPLFSLLVSAEFRFWPFGQGRHANISLATPGSIVVGVVDIVALNQFGVMADQQAVRFGLMLQVRGLIISIPAERLVGQIAAK